MRKKEVIKRLNYVHGQLGAIIKMVEKGDDFQKIYLQLRSIESAFNKSVLQTFEDENRLALAQLIVEELDVCPGSCKSCDTIGLIKLNFPKLNIDEVLKSLKEIKNLKERKNKNA